MLWCRYNAALEKANYSALAMRQQANEDVIGAIGVPLLLGIGCCCWVRTSSNFLPNHQGVIYSDTMAGSCKDLRACMFVIGIRASAYPQMRNISTGNLAFIYGVQLQAAVLSCNQRTGW